MKFFVRLFAVSLFLTWLGSSVVVASNPTHPSFNFSDIERLQVGKTDGKQFVKLFGSPDRLVHLNNSQDAWLYLEELNGTKVQRLGLVVDAKSDSILSITWVLRDSELLQSEGRTLSHFTSSKFNISDVGKVAKDFHSDDVEYEDPTHGISFQVSKGNHKVQSISFVQPNDLSLANHE